jgi:hypothetical protein
LLEKGVGLLLSCVGNRIHLPSPRRVRSAPVSQLGQLKRSAESKSSCSAAGRQAEPHGGAAAQSCASHLAAADAELLSLTPESARSPWIHYEVGLLAAAVGEGTKNPRIYTDLLGLQPSDLTGPLVAYQSTAAGRRHRNSSSTTSKPRRLLVTTAPDRSHRPVLKPRLPSARRRASLDWLARPGRLPCARADSVSERGRIGDAAPDRTCAGRAWPSARVGPPRRRPLIPPETHGQQPVRMLMHGTGRRARLFPEGARKSGRSLID